MKLLSRLNEEDIAKLRMWEENTEADYSRISINHLLTQLRTLSIGAIERILEDPALIQMLESSMIALPGPVEEISEAILDLSREDIENLQSWNSLTSPNHKINIFTLKSFVAISRAIASEVLNELAELKWIDFKAAFNVASDRITTITINAKGIAPEDITKLKLFNSCPEEALAEAGIASLVSFARKFSSAGLEILVRLPDILSHLSAEPEHLIKLAELFEVHNHKFKFFDHDILYSRPEKLDAISLFLNSCDLDQLDSLKNLGILARIRFEDNIDIYKCLEFLVKSNEEKLAAIIEDDQVYSIFSYNANSIKIYCRKGIEEGYSPQQIIKFVSHIGNYPLFLLQYKSEDEITGRNLHKIIPFIEFINLEQYDYIQGKIYNLINDPTFNFSDLPGVGPALIMENLDHYIRVAQVEQAGPIGEDEMLDPMLEDGQPVDYLGALARLYAIGNGEDGIA